MNANKKTLITISHSLVSSFSELDDPRVKGRCEHKLIDIIFIVLSAMLCGENDFEAMEEFAKAQKKWLKKFLELPNGIPSHDTLRRVFSMIDGDAFENIFNKWINSSVELLAGEVIAFDGKIVNGTGKKWWLGEKHNRTRPLALVSVWASKTGLVLGQKKSASTGTSEVNAIYECLEVIDISGHVVTVDAASSTHNLASVLLEKGGNYLFPVKRNRGNYKDEIERLLRKKNLSFNEGKDVVHKNRKDERVCRVYNVKDNKEAFEGSGLFEKFPEINSIIRIRYTREKERGKFLEKKRNKDGQVYDDHSLNKSIKVKEDFEKYYVSSLKEKDALRYIEMTRDHWGIENGLHWRLDNLFNEDDNRVRDKNTSQNMSCLRRVVLNLLTIAQKKLEKKKSISKIQTNCIFDQDYREKVLFGHNQI